MQSEHPAAHGTWAVVLTLGEVAQMKRAFQHTCMREARTAAMARPEVEPNFPPHLVLGALKRRRARDGLLNVPNTDLRSRTGRNLMYCAVPL